MATETTDLTLELLKGLQRDLRQVQQGLASLSEIVTRQGARLERQIADVRSGVEGLIRMEIGGAIANLETRIDNRLDRHTEEMRLMVREEVSALAAELRTSLKG